MVLAASACTKEAAAGWQVEAEELVYGAWMVGTTVTVLRYDL